MPHNLDHTISLLSRTPAALNAFLRDLPDPWTLRNEGDKTGGERTGGERAGGERTGGERTGGENRG